MLMYKKTVGTAEFAQEPIIVNAPQFSLILDVAYNSVVKDEIANLI